MDKEKIEKKLEQVAGGMDETDFLCDDGMDLIKCKFKGKRHICPIGYGLRVYYDCGDCKAEKRY